MKETLFDCKRARESAGAKNWKYKIQNRQMQNRQKNTKQKVQNTKF